MNNHWWRLWDKTNKAPKRITARKRILVGVLALAALQSGGAGVTEIMLGRGESAQEKRVEGLRGFWPGSWVDSYVRIYKLARRFPETAQFAKRILDFLPSGAEFERLFGTIDAAVNNARELIASNEELTEDTRALLGRLDEAQRSYMLIRARMQQSAIAKEYLDNSLTHLLNRRFSEARDQLRQAQRMAAEASDVEALDHMITILAALQETITNPDPQLKQKLVQGQRAVQDAKDELDRIHSQMGELKQVQEELLASEEYQLMLNLVDNLQPDELRMTMHYAIAYLLLGIILSMGIVLVGIKGSPGAIRLAADGFRLRMSDYYKFHPDSYLPKNLASSMLMHDLLKIANGIPDEELEKLRELAKETGRNEELEAALRTLGVE